MPSSDTAPPKATSDRSQFQATSAADTASPTRVSRPSTPRRASGQNATTSSRTTPAAASASSGAIARQAISGVCSGTSAFVWASRCTGSSIAAGAGAPGGHGGHGLRGLAARPQGVAGALPGGLGGDLGDLPGGGLDALEQRSREEPQRDDGREQRHHDRPLAPVEVGDGPVLLVGQLPMPHPLI